MVVNVRDIAYTWGSTLEERLMPFPCDQFLESGFLEVLAGVELFIPGVSRFAAWLLVCCFSS
ncbi:hypothetical protein ABN584_06655 [Gloeocapsa sp. BRSZ]